MKCRLRLSFCRKTMRKVCFSIFRICLTYPSYYILLRLKNASAKFYLKLGAQFSTLYPRRSSTSPRNFTFLRGISVTKEVSSNILHQVLKFCKTCSQFQKNGKHVRPKRPMTQTLTLLSVGLE